MKNNLRKYKITYLALLFYVLTFLCLFFLKNAELKVYLTCFGIVTSLYFGALKHQLSNDALFHELFIGFNERYDDELNDLLNELRSDENKSLTTKNKNLVIDYFNLCAEEYLWQKKGRLQDDVWSAWRSGILENLKIKQVLEIYKDEMRTPNGRKAYYGLEDELKIINKKST